MLPALILREILRHRRCFDFETPSVVVSLSAKRFLCQDLDRTVFSRRQPPVRVAPSRLSSFPAAAEMSEPKIAAVKVATDLKSGDFDGVVVVGASVNDIPHDVLKTPLKAVLAADAAAEHGLFVAPGKDVKRVVFSGTGPLDKDYDDVRRYYRPIELI